MMPGMDGFQVAECICGDERQLDCVIIMLSSLDEKADRDRCRRLGVSRTLVKPVSPSSLFNAIVNLVSKNLGSDSDQDSTGSSRDLPAGVPAGLKILVAEDNPVNLRLARRLLERAGLQADAAGNGALAIQALESQSYDLVLMDVQMPEMDGIEATLRIREREKETGKHVPIVALTAHSMKGDRERFLAAGMDDYLSKPLDARQLYGAIARHTQPPTSAGPGPRNAGIPAGDRDLNLLDVAKLVDRVADDRELAGEILNIFVREHRKMLGDVRQTIEQGDPGALKTAAHGFKGTAANISAEALRVVCLQLEHAAEAGDLAEAGRLLRKLESVLDQTITVVRRSLAEGV
jgi:CheY-like chemotaxis protein/HPt (histidine-containing phosphotransfer) domain-containing protein